MDTPENQLKKSSRTISTVAEIIEIYENSPPALLSEAEPGYLERTSDLVKCAIYLNIDDGEFFDDVALKEMPHFVSACIESIEKSYGAVIEGDALEYLTVVSRATFLSLVLSIAARAYK